MEGEASLPCLVIGEVGKCLVQAGTSFTCLLGSLCDVNGCMLVYLFGASKATAKW